MSNKKTIIFGGVKVVFFCFKQIDGEGLLLVVVAVAIFSVDKPLDFHDTTFSVSASLLKLQ